MKTADPDTETEETAAPLAPDTPAYLKPNAEGVFETPESVMISGLPAGYAGELYLAPALWCPGTVRIYVGYFLHIRSPKNTAKHLPAAGMPSFLTREAAIHWLISEVALNFFSEHKAAVKAVRAWWQKNYAGPKPDAETRRRGDTEKEQTPNAQVPEVSASPRLPLSASSAGASVSSHFATIAVADIEPNPDNPRREIVESELAELVDSIRAQGFLLQPIAVRDRGETAAPRRYRLIAGHRRWEAHKRLEWPTIEAKVFLGVDDARAGELALIENLQRRDLNPMEEANGYAELRDHYGYTAEKIAERLGRTVNVVWHNWKLVALPARVQELIRSGSLSAAQGRALARDRWASRPQHCIALAECAAEQSIPSPELSHAKPTRRTIAALCGKNLACEVSSYRESLDVPQGEQSPNSNLIEASDGTVWHLAPAQWKEEKKEIDRAQREREERELERAARRVATAQEARVNVKVEDLSRAGLDYVPLTGENARFEPHLPAEIKATGTSKDDAELVVCLKPEALARLKARETELINTDTLAKLPALLDRATAQLKRLKKIGARELAFLLDMCATNALLDGEAWERQTVPVPASDLTRETLASLDPADLARVAIESALLNSAPGELTRSLRWILDTPNLGLVEDNAELREKFLAAAATEVFAKVDADQLAQWVRARALGMPIAEIARSYGATEEDVRGALGVSG